MAVGRGTSGKFLDGPRPISSVCRLLRERVPITRERLRRVGGVSRAQAGSWFPAADSTGLSKARDG